MRLRVSNRDTKVKIVRRAHYNNMYQLRKLINQLIKIVVLFNFPGTGLQCNMHLCGEEKYLTCNCCPCEFDFKDADEMDCDVCDENNSLYSEPKETVAMLL